MIWSLFSVSVLLLLSALLPIWSYIFNNTSVNRSHGQWRGSRGDDLYRRGSGRAGCGLCHGTVYFRNCDWWHEWAVDCRNIGGFYFLAIRDFDYWIAEPMYRGNFLLSTTEVQAFLKLIQYNSVVLLEHFSRT